MTLLVTGSAGFIGSCFVRQHFEHRVEPIVSLDALTYAGDLSTLQSVMKNPAHVFVQGDITDSQLIECLLVEHQPRAVINFAAETHVDRSIHAPQQFLQTNIQGTFTLLEAVRRYYADLSIAKQQTFRFLQISTDEVYGSLSKTDPAFTEQTPCQPNSPYAASKASADHLVRAWFHTYQLPVLITRCSNNYGPWHFPEKLIPLMILNALSGKPLPIYGDGLQVRDWLFVEDHTQAIWNVLESGKIGEVYNIGGNNEQTNVAVVQAICALLDQLNPRADGLSFATQIRHVADRQGHDRRYAMCTQKIHAQFNWQAQTKFVDGLRQTVQWYLDHLDWVSAIQARPQYRNWVQQQYTERA